MVTIATFNEPSKAKHLKERLQQSGVKADVHNEGQMQAAMMAKPMANAKVLVEEQDFEQAHQLMIDWETTDPDIGAAIRCPNCQSPRIEYPQMTRRFRLPWIANVLFAMKLFDKEFYCRDCQFTWGGENPR
jgi:predicted Zn-ribbon and HTH transcriptional regulator